MHGWIQCNCTALRPTQSKGCAPCPTPHPLLHPRAPRTPPLPPLSTRTRPFSWGRSPQSVRIVPPLSVHVSTRLHPLFCRQFNQRPAPRSCSLPVLKTDPRRLVRPSGRPRARAERPLRTIPESAVLPRARRVRSRGKTTARRGGGGGRRGGGGGRVSGDGRDGGGPRWRRRRRWPERTGCATHGHVAAGGGGRRRRRRRGRRRCRAAPGAAAGGARGVCAHVEGWEAAGATWA